MDIFLVILIFIGFAFLLISENDDKTVSDSSCNRIDKVIWNPLIFDEKVFKTGFDIYKQGVAKYQISSESASQDFRLAYDTIQKLTHQHSQNPILYLYLIECAMGFNYDIAITIGYNFFKLTEHNAFSFEEIGSVYDMSRKMYKLLLVKGKFDEAKRFANKTLQIGKSISECTYNQALERERDIAEYFYANLCEGNYDVRHKIVSGFDSPEPWYHFDNINLV